MALGGPGSHLEECPLLALSGHLDRLRECPLSGVKRTSLAHPQMSAFDPKRTSMTRHETAPDSKLEAGTASWVRAGNQPNCKQQWCSTAQRANCLSLVPFFSSWRGANGAYDRDQPRFVKDRPGWHISARPTCLYRDRQGVRLA